MARRRTRRTEGRNRMGQSDFIPAPVYLTSRTERFREGLRTGRGRGRHR